MINLRQTNFNTFSGRGGYVFSIGRFPSLVESVLSVQMDVLSPMHLLLVRALHLMVQGITGPEPNTVQGPPPSKRERERDV